MVVFFLCRYLQEPECEDEQFVFQERGAVSVKGMKTPVHCYLLSRNLRKLPKVQLLLENDLAIGSRSPLLPSPSGGKNQVITPGLV